jgi:hypothetical protein
MDVRWQFEGELKRSNRKEDGTWDITFRGKIINIPSENVRLSSASLEDINKEFNVDDYTKITITRFIPELSMRDVLMRKYGNDGV